MMTEVDETVAEDFRSDENFLEIVFFAFMHRLISRLILLVLIGYITRSFSNSAEKSGEDLKTYFLI